MNKILSIATPLLEKKDVHIWKVQLDDRILKKYPWTNFMSQNELAYASRFKFEKDRSLWLVAHAYLKILLAEYSGLEIGKLDFYTNQYGKPYLKSPKELYFNISHSERCILFAFQWYFEVGIDVEFTKRQVEVLKISKRFFSEREYREIDQLPANQQRAAFYRCWTRKESIIKAVGLGLSIPLDLFSVDIRLKDFPKVYDFKWEDEIPASWKLFSFQPFTDYIAAVATKNPKAEFSIQTLNQAFLK